MSFFERIAQRTGDKLMYALGSQQAKGRLKVGVAIDKIHSDWAVYRGTNGSSKNWQNFVQFMDREYGADLDVGMFDRNTSGSDIDDIVAHVAMTMVQNGKITVDF